jgi:hypothetical protein
VVENLLISYCLYNIPTHEPGGDLISHVKNKNHYIVNLFIILVAVLAMCGAQEQDMEVEIKEEPSNEPRTCEDLPTNNQHASNPPDLRDEVW